MADQGLATELINATEVTISDGTDNYIQLQELDCDLSHPETIEETVDTVHYFYGHQQGFIEGTILASTPEISTFITDCQVDSNGAASSHNWAIAYKNVSGSTGTLTATGTMAPNLRIIKPIGGAVRFRFRIRITELITSADIT